MTIEVEISGELFYFKNRINYMNPNFVFFEAILSPCQNAHFKKRFATSGFNLYTIYERIERSFHTISQIPSEYHVFQMILSMHQ